MRAKAPDCGTLEARFTAGRVSALSTAIRQGCAWTAGHEPPKPCVVVPRTIQTKRGPVSFQARTGDCPPPPKRPATEGQVAQRAAMGAAAAACKGQKLPEFRLCVKGELDGLRSAETAWMAWSVTGGRARGEAEPALPAAARARILASERDRLRRGVNPIGTAANLRLLSGETVELPPNDGASVAPTMAAADDGAAEHREREASFVRDRTTGMGWLEFAGKPGPDVIAALKREGWRWGGYRKAWYRPGRFSTPPASIPFRDDGEVNYSEERAERLGSRAERTQAEGNARYESGHKRLEAIPFGQPILVGHHSEHRDRNYRSKAVGSIEKGFELMGKARELESRAAGSEARVDRYDRPDVIVRRIDRLRADAVAFLNGSFEAGSGKRLKAGLDLPPLEKVQELGIRLTDRGAQHYTAVLQEIDRQRAMLADAGGDPRAKALAGVQKGDIIRHRGDFAVVERIGSKNATVRWISGQFAGDLAFGTGPVALEKLGAPHMKADALSDELRAKIEEARTTEAKRRRELDEAMAEYRKGRR
jgi:hypothetical protein